MLFNQNFSPKLRQHCLARLQGVESSRNFSNSELTTLEIRDNKIYRHHRVRVNYTTYDIRRAQDSINPRTRRDLMVLSDSTDHGAHPYWYARAITVFHAYVRQRNAPGDAGKFTRMDFIWVRWYSEPLSRCGWAAKRLPRVSFLAQDDPNAFGFINPADIIRGAHLIPAFIYGGVGEDLLSSPSLARFHGGDSEDECDDWNSMYVNM